MPLKRLQMSWKRQWKKFAEDAAETADDIVEDTEEAVEAAVEETAEILEDAAEEAVEAAEGEAATETTDGGVPMVVGYSPFNSKFSPFFAETAYDQDVQKMTQLVLLNSDRMGAVIYKGIEGETIEYNGTEYTYYSPADCVVTENEDGTVYYDFTLRDDLVFSDGEPVTIDDVIFSMYVNCDPTYDGYGTLFSQPIEGLAEYRSGMETLFNLLVAAGEDNTDFSLWTEEEQTAFWTSFNAAAEAFAQEIVDYCKAAGYNAEDDSVAACAANRGFELAEDATVKDFWDTMMESYGGDVMTLSSTEKASSTLPELMADYDNYTKGIETGTSAPNITGIQKTGDYSMRVVATQVDATLIYQRGKCCDGEYPCEISLSETHKVSCYRYDPKFAADFPKGGEK